MGIGESLKKKFSLDEDYYDDYDDGFFDEDEFDEKPKRKSFFGRSKDNSTNEGLDEQDKNIFNKRSKVTPIEQRRATMDVCVLKPQSYNDATDISDALLERKAVVLNLETINVDIAQRIIDYATGVCVAINGSFKSVSGRVFVITPKNIDITGGLDDLLLNNFGMEK